MCDKSLRAATLAVALQYDQVQETSENWGPEVQQFLAAANIKFPAPWCAAFINFCAEKAAKALGVTSPLEAIVNEGYVQDYVNYGKKHGWLIPAKRAVPGDLYCLYYPSLKRYGHIGMLIALEHGQTILYGVEGNTNDDGGREGKEVAKKRRKVTSQVVFLRWT